MPRRCCRPLLLCVPFCLILDSCLIFPSHGEKGPRGESLSLFRGALEPYQKRASLPMAPRPGLRGTALSHVSMVCVRGNLFCAAKGRGFTNIMKKRQSPTAGPPNNITFLRKGVDNLYSVLHFKCGQHFSHSGHVKYAEKAPLDFGILPNSRPLSPLFYRKTTIIRYIVPDIGRSMELHFLIFSYRFTIFRLDSPENAGISAIGKAPPGSRGRTPECTRKELGIRVLWSVFLENRNQSGKMRVSRRIFGGLCRKF